MKQIAHIVPPERSDEVDTEMGAMLEDTYRFLLDIGACPACRAPFMIKHLLAQIIFQNELFDDDGKPVREHLDMMVEALVKDAIELAEHMQGEYIEEEGENIPPSKHGPH